MRSSIKIIGSAEQPAAVLGSGTVCYARVSSEDPTRQTLSTGAQVDLMKAYCRLHSLGDPMVLTERKSAKNLKGRPVFMDILRMCQGGQVKHLVVCEITRLSRDLGDANKVFDELDRLGVTLHGATRGIDRSTADGKFVSNLDVILGVRERELLSERTRRALNAKPRVPYNPKDNPAMQRRALEHKHLHGIPPLGYRFKKGIRNGQLRVVALEEDPHEIAMIRFIFKRRREGATYPQIAAELPPNGFRTRGGGLYGYRRVEHIVKTPMFWPTVNQEASDGPTGPTIPAPAE